MPKRASSSRPQRRPACACASRPPSSVARARSRSRCRAALLSTCATEVRDFRSSSCPDSLPALEADVSQGWNCGICLTIAARANGSVPCRTLRPPALVFPPGLLFGREHGLLRFRWPAGLDRFDRLDGRKKTFRRRRCQQKQPCTDELALLHGPASIEAALLEYRELFVVLPGHREGVAHNLFLFDMLPAPADGARRRRFKGYYLPGLWLGRHTSGLLSLDRLPAGHCLVGTVVRGYMRSLAASVPGSHWLHDFFGFE